MALSFKVLDHTHQLFPYRNIETIMFAKSKSSYSGVGARIAKKVKKQFHLQNFEQVRSVRRALKKYKRMEERDAIKARMNTLKAQMKIAPRTETSEDQIQRINNSIANPFSANKKRKSKAKIGPKPVGLRLSLDVASELYEGAAFIKGFDPQHRKITTLNFVGSYLHTSTLPSLGLPEICLVGRSNVGKSSFINSLMSYIRNKSRKSDIAFVSKTPGYTKSVNIFEAIDVRDRGVLSLVDLPGYGATAVKNAETRKTMQSVMKAYIKRRNELKLVLFLVDGSVEPQHYDYEVHQYFKSNNIPHLFILTKMDKVTVPQTAGQIIAFRQYFDLTSPLPIPFSKFGGGDLGAIWRAIFDACIDSFDVSKLNLTDKFGDVQPDFTKFVGAQAQISLKDLRKLVFKNFDVLPESVKSLDIGAMDRDQLLDVLDLAAKRKFELEKQPLDLVHLKHKLKRR